MNCKQLAAFLIILSSLSISFCKSSNTLPLFGLEIPQESKMNSMSIMQEQEQFDKINVIIKIKNPQALWKDELSLMINQDINNLKVVMRDYVTNNLGLSKISNYFTSFNGFSATINYEEYQSLLNNPLVEDIIEDKKVYASLFESTQSIGATDTWNIQLNNQNLTGLGQTVCIIDTGIDYTHPDFGGCEGIYESDEMVLETPITSPNYPNNYSNNFDDYVGIISMPGYDFIQIYFDSLYTEIGYDWVYFYNSTYDLIGGYSGGGESLEFWSTDLPYDTIYVKFLSDEDINYTSFNITKVRGYNSTSSHICDKVIGGYDFYNDDPNPMDDEGHGTHVAGIIAANGSIKGVAPDAKIVAIKALGNDGGWNADIISGIEYCTNHADEYNITVISMSLGGEELYDNYCDSDNSLMATAINNAVAKNISVVVATGNNGSLTKISSPACIQNATRVGSSLKSIDELSSFSNRWALDMLVAPGSLIFSTYFSPYYTFMSGTSMATPHISGAIAILNQYFLGLGEEKTPNELNNIIKNNATIISQDGIDYYRINLKKIFGLNTEPSVNITTELFINKGDLIEAEIDNFFLSSVSCDLYMNNSFLDQLYRYEETIFYTIEEGYEGYYNFSINCSDSYGNKANDSKELIYNLAPEFIEANDLNLTTNEGEGIWVNTSWNTGMYGELNGSYTIIFENFSNGLNLNNLGGYSFEEECSFNEFKNETYFYFEPFENMTGKNITFVFQVHDIFNNYAASEELEFEYDDYGNTTSITFFSQNNLTTYIKDITAPILNIVNLSQNSTNANQTFAFNISDNVEFKQVNCSLFINNNYSSSFFVIPNGSMNYLEKELPQGYCEYKLMCEDYDSNNASVLGNIFIDSIAPIITLNLPNNIYYNTSEILLNAIIIEENLDKAFYNINNGENISYIESTILNLIDGEYIINFYANDSLGNIAYVSKNFTVDTVNPSLEIISPINESIINSTIIISGIIFDENIANVSLFIDNELKQTKTENYTYFYYYTLLLSEGNHSFGIKAMDYAGNYNFSSIILEVSNRKPLTIELNENSTINSTLLNGTGFESIIEEIKGINSPNVTIQLINGTNNNLTSTIGALNITASTISNSTINFMIPQSLLSGINYNNVIVYAIHSNGLSEKIKAYYISNTTIGDIVFERFNFTTSHYSVFYYGEGAICGDGIVGPGETCSNCEADCGTCPVPAPVIESSPVRSSGGVSYVAPVIHINKTYELFNSSEQEFMLNESNAVNISGTNYSFMLFSINESFARINVSNYGIIRFNLGQTKTFNLTGMIFNATLKSINNGSIIMSFKIIPLSTNTLDESGISNITSNIALQESLDNTKDIGLFVMILSLSAGIILIILKAIKLF